MLAMMRSEIQIFIFIYGVDIGENYYHDDGGGDNDVEGCDNSKIQKKNFKT